MLWIVSGVVSLSWLNYRARHWEQTQGQITSLQARVKTADINYEYTFDSRSYVGNRVAFLHRGSIAEKNHVVSQYQVGDSVVLYVNGSNPSYSVLEVRNLSDGYFGNELLLFTVLAFFFIWNLYLIKKEAEKVSVTNLKH